MSNTENYNKLFIGGDLSGIQKFLYNITSKKAAVSLKGRSFYLREYMESKCNELTRLPAVAKGSPEVIYCSGGKFYVIAENTPQIQEELKEYTRKSKAEIWKEHKGQLSINLSWIPFSENADKSINANGEKDQKLGYLWQCITEDFARQKNQKFLEEIKENYEDFFEVIEVGGKPKVCAVTGIESDDLVKFNYKDDKKDEESIYILPSVRAQIQLGETLREAERTHTFEEYAKDDNGDTTYLGILRMDVDGLGKIFAKGYPTIDEYKAFSNHLDAYFTNREDKESRLHEIQQNPNYRDHTNILYAGGDDIFVVGRWDKVIDLASEVRNDFVKYINKDGVSISGGVAIVHPKFPIAKAAEMAGEAEDTAKAHTWNDEQGQEHQKDSFCMFGQAVSWENEFEYVKKYKEAFVDLIDKFDMPRGILHKIMTYAAIESRNEEKKKQGKTPDYSYIWHSAYYLTRMIERQKKNDEVVEFCKSLRDKELNGAKGRYRLMAIAARWAELTLRMKKE